MDNRSRLGPVLDAVLEQGVANGAVPGVVAAVTTRDGPVYEAAFGLRRLGETQPMTPDSLFRVASLTKAIVAAGVVQQVERGRLTLDQPLGQLVPYLGAVQVLAGYDGDGRPMLRPPRTPVTLRHLLTHTSGFGYELWNAGLDRYCRTIGHGGSGPAGWSTPLLFDPGTRWEYGVGLDWAGQVLQAATGQRLSAYFAANLFGPLGMEAGWTVDASRQQRLASPHQRQADGSLTAEPAGAPTEVEHEGGGSGIYTTAADYLKFIRMILNGGTGNGARVLDGDSVAFLSSPDAAPNNAVLPLRSTDPTRSADGEFFPGVPKRQALGFIVNDVTAPTGRSAGSLAWAGAANCYYWIDPSRGIGGVYMAQLLPFLDRQALPLFLDFETAVYSALS